MVLYSSPPESNFVLVTSPPFLSPPWFYSLHPLSKWYMMCFHLCSLQSSMCIIVERCDIFPPDFRLFLFWCNKKGEMKRFWNTMSVGEGESNEPEVSRVYITRALFTVRRVLPLFVWQEWLGDDGESGSYGDWTTRWSFVTVVQQGEDNSPQKKILENFICTKVELKSKFNWQTNRICWDTLLIVGLVYQS